MCIHNRRVLNGEEDLLTQQPATRVIIFALQVVLSHLSALLIRTLSVDFGRTFPTATK